MISLGAPFPTTPALITHPKLGRRCESPAVGPSQLLARGSDRQGHTGQLPAGSGTFWATGRNQTGNDTPRCLTLAKPSSTFPTFHPSQLFDGCLLPPACTHCCCLPRSAGRGDPRWKAKQTKRSPHKEKASLSTHGPGHWA